MKSVKKECRNCMWYLENKVRCALLCDYVMPDNSCRHHCTENIKK